MGHFIFDDVDRLELEDGEWIEIKRQMSVGDYDHIARESREDEERIIATLLVNIKAWSLKDKEGKVAPINKKTIAMLNPDTATQIIAEIGKRNSTPKKG